MLVNVISSLSYYISIIKIFKLSWELVMTSRQLSTFVVFTAMTCCTTTYLSSPTFLVTCRSDFSPLIRTWIIFPEGQVTS